MAIKINISLESKGDHDILVGTLYRRREYLKEMFDKPMVDQPVGKERQELTVELGAIERLIQQVT